MWRDMKDLCWKAFGIPCLLKSALVYVVKYTKNYGQPGRQGRKYWGLLRNWDSNAPKKSSEAANFMSYAIRSSERSQRRGRIMRRRQRGKVCRELPRSHY